MLSTLLLALALARLLQAVSLWDPTGPYHVGYTQHIFNHTTPNDPTSPGTFMLLTVYYPTAQAPNQTVPYLDPISARIFENTTGLPNGSLSTLATPLQFQAPTLLTNDSSDPRFGNATSPYPTLIFTPGAGLPAVVYTAYLSELASHGLCVVAIDHPGEAPYLQLPYDGGGVYGYPDWTNFPTTLEGGFQVYDYRVSDILAAVSEAYFPALVKLYGAPFQIERYGVFGHSVGGAAAAGVMAANDTRLARLFKLGSNLDGSLIQLVSLAAGGYDPSIPVPDLKRPFLELASESHFEGNESGGPGGDATSQAFNDGQTGWLRDVQVNGTRHLDYSDIPLWVDRLGQRGGKAGTFVGPIDGVRVTGIVSKFLLKFFGALEGRGLGGVDRLIEKTPEADVLFAQN